MTHLTNRGIFKKKNFHILVQVSSELESVGNPPVDMYWVQITTQFLKPHNVSYTNKELSTITLRTGDWSNNGSMNIFSDLGIVQNDSDECVLPPDKIEEFLKDLEEFDEVKMEDAFIADILEGEWNHINTNTTYKTDGGESLKKFRANLTRESRGA